VIRGGDGRDKLLGLDDNDWIDGGPGDDYALQGGNGDDVVIDGDGNDHFIKGDPGDDTFFVGPGEDKVFGEQGNDTIYLYDDGARDEFYCDDYDDIGTAQEGKADRVIYIGRIDPLDKIRAERETCESITVINHYPESWPYGPVPGVS
jgi:Ca2+-binding RTX toxin-like protein